MRVLMLSGTSLSWNKFARSEAMIHSSGKTHLPEAKMKKEGYYMFSLCYFYPSGFQLNCDLQSFGYDDPLIHHTEAPFESKTPFLKLKRK